MNPSPIVPNCSTFVAALNSNNSQYNTAWSALKLAWNVMMEDKSTLKLSTDFTKIHAMGGQLQGGEYQTPSAAKQSAVDYINSEISSGTIHSAQDLSVHAGESMQDYSFFSIHTVRDFTGGGTIGQAYRNTMDVLNGNRAGGCGK